MKSYRAHLLAAGVIGLGTALAAPSQAAETRVLETGSSLLYPLFNLWVPAYTKDHKVEITTQSTGSGTGISEAVSGLAQIGASDAYLSPAMRKQHANMLNIPLAISSQMVNYNLPELNGRHLKLSGPVLAGIYDGTITDWDNKQIARLNPGVKLPHHAIIPIHRTDGSGDTFIFTQFLSDSTPHWQQAHGYGTTISWPAIQSEIGAEGNQGMVNALQQNPYSVAYIGISYKGAITQNKLGEAALENRAGKFVLANDKTVQAAAAALGGKTPADEAVSLIFQPGAESYPIINYEYAIVDAQMGNPPARDVRDFLSWSIRPDGGNAPHFMNQVNFVALPAAVRRLSQKQINEIGKEQNASN
ncbi:MAG TPA: phosphate ABC transporter substrate-binding protein PstS [Acetobacteraceae bacterium]|nr:phosphate ABC transporter substrate-binding protein PstS [Acetobacteraceae bacterium]